ncbi:MAG: hypothetical protein EXR18_05080 [Flavobacteriaceae bacterium]|nr:hypothetical protein [Flavobacteriaceae bacterium]
MMGSKGIIGLLSFLFFQLGLAQEKKDSLFLRLNLNFRNESFERNKKYISESKDTLEIETFRFYISNVQLHFSDETTFSEPKSYHLIDIENPSSFQIPIAKTSDKSISKVTFSIGIDSLASVSGAMSGDLDATKGMYWAWQSGFINMKIEGKSTSCKTRKNAFQFHIGGYMKPNYAIRTIELKPINSNLEIGVDLAELFKYINLSENNSIMIPGSKAMELADKTIQMFSVTSTEN